MDWLNRLKQKSETDSEGASRRAAEASPTISESGKPEVVEHLEIFTKSQDQSINVYSAKLNRRITVSWIGSDPQEVCVDGRPFSLKEIASMSQANRSGKDLETLLLIKEHLGVRPD
jgi:hypothetical protein